MGATVSSSHEQLLAALEASDQRRRELRAKRIEWLAQYEVRPQVVMGRAETLHLLDETREVFVDGHFVATLMMAIAFIEHAIVEELQLLGHVQGSPTLGQALQTSMQHGVFPTEWIQRVSVLSRRRNPFAHLKEGNHPHTLGMRVRLEKTSPATLVEADAREAVQLMYKFFLATLRRDA